MLNRKKMVVFLVPFFLIFVSVTVKIFYPDTYIVIIQEDHLLEYLQFLFYLLAGIFAFLAAKLFGSDEKINKILFLLLAMAIAFVAFEEISWGQRIFGIETPEYIATINTQNEISIHNMEFFQRSLHFVYALIGLYGSTVWWQRDNTVRPSFLEKSKEYIFPPFYISSYFYFTFIFYYYFLLSDHGVLSIRVGAPGSWVIPRDQEPVETILALGFMIFTLDVFRRLKHARNNA